MPALSLAALGGFMPHGHCFLWRQDLLWLHVGSDALIALAYYSIPVALVYVARKRPDFRIGWLLTAFGAFILLCGTTHVMEIVTMWRPHYYASGYLKATTAAVSVLTAVLLWPFVPVALRIPTTSQLEERNRALRSEAEVRERTEAELQRSNAELEQFAYIVSHDLTEPLRMITSYLQLIEKRYKEQLDEEGEKFIGYAVDGSTRMRGMLGDLLEYSRVGRAEIASEPVDMNLVCENVLADLSGQISDTGGKVEVGELPTVRGSEPMLRQLMQNLIGNALKYHGEGPPKVHIDSVHDSDTVRIRVRDEGIGLDTKFAERIFAPFQRLHARGQYAGSGIGLAVARRVVERHGGSIRVESQPGKGATFVVTLPA